MGERLIRVGDGCGIACDYREAASRPVLIFSNSLGADRSMWAPQIAAFAGDFAALTYDTRGHGRSEAPSGAYSIDRLAQDVLDLMDALDIATAHFCGLSLGGMTGQALGSRAPERFRSLVLSTTSAYMGPPAGWQERIETVGADGMAAVADIVLGRWFTPDFAHAEPEIVARMRAQIVGTDPAGYAGCCAAIRDMDLRATAASIRVRTLIIAGDQDEATPLPHGQFLHEHIRGSRLVTLAAAHLANVEQPVAFNDALRAFWKED
ncbi:MAG: 3-oxoadipate enol-lactonase [Sphingomonadales bacterium]|nr:3-oxoadipate enol-lactonase [Sphingomonadales bacterium]